MLNRPPREALDGVGTFWELNRSAVSLFTYRFADVASADREYQTARRRTRQLPRCSGGGARTPGEPRNAHRHAGRPGREYATADRYVLTTNDGTKLAVNVLAFENTISWQFRYEPVLGTYLPLTAQRVMDSLTDQMRAVQDLHR